MIDQPSPSDLRDAGADPALEGLAHHAMHRQARPTPPMGSNPQAVPELLNALLAGRPLEVVTENADPQDAQATKILLDAYGQPDGYHCPRCSLITQDPTDFLKHIAQEFTAGLQAYLAQSSSTKPQPTRPPRHTSTTPKSYNLTSKR